MPTSSSVITSGGSRRRIVGPAGKRDDAVIEHQRLEDGRHLRAELDGQHQSESANVAHDRHAVETRAQPGEHRSRPGVRFARSGPRRDRRAARRARPRRRAANRRTCCRARPDTARRARPSCRRTRPSGIRRQALSPCTRCRARGRRARRRTSVPVRPKPV